jgi:creatinine amidohydrolase/Fe(II)-dependent formamide hydrolase-like protein
MDDMPFVCQATNLRPDGFTSPIQHPSDHAGEGETCEIMWIRPDLVRRDKLAKNPVSPLRTKSLKRANFVRQWHLYLPTSAGGEARKSSAEKGKIQVEAEAQALSELLVDLSKAKYDRRFPYR